MTKRCPKCGIKYLASLYECPVCNLKRVVEDLKDEVEALKKKNR